MTIKSFLFLTTFFYSSFALANYDVSGKLLLTGGATQIEGASGGGITPWAFIGGNGTKEQVGANAFYTSVITSDYRLESLGVLIGIYDRLELSLARQVFDTQEVGILLGLGRSYKIKQNILGLKIKIIGDAVLDQDSWLPQISIGTFYKENRQGATIKSLGARADHGLDIYLSATKIFLSESILANITLRSTKANQMGILGFGGNLNDSLELQFESSLAYLLTRKLAAGFEFRTKPDNLKGIKEENWGDLFLAWAPTKNISLVGSYALLGTIANKDNQTGYYTSLQIGF